MIKVIETERIILRELDDLDLNALAEIYADPEVMRFVGNGSVLNREQTAKSISNWKKYYERFKFGNWATVEKDTSEFIGLCGLSWLPDNSDIEVSYLFSKPSWGKGFATETAKAILDYGFNNLGLKRIVALVYPENSTSIHVIEKLGMKHEGEKEFFGKKLLFYSLEN